MLGHTLHHVSSHYTAGWRKRSEKAWENGAKKRGKTAGKGEKTRDEKEKGKDGNRLERQGHGGTHCRTEEKEKL